MSGQLSTAMIFVSVIAIALAASQAEQNESGGGRMANAVTARRPASVAKDLVLSEFDAEDVLRHTEKVHGSVTVSIDLAGAKPTHVGDVFVLRGTIASEDEVLDRVTFKWAVPKGVRVVNGQVSGIVTGVGPGRPAVRQLTLEKVSAQNEQVHLMAGAFSGTTRFAEAAQFNTDVQDTLDTDRKAQRKAMEAAAPLEAEPVKVFH